VVKKPVLGVPRIPRWSFGAAVPDTPGAHPWGLDRDILSLTVRHRRPKIPSLPNEARQEQVLFSCGINSILRVAARHTRKRKRVVKGSSTDMMVLEVPQAIPHVVGWRHQS